MERERVHAYDTGSRDLYLHTWEGHCLRVLDGAVYADEMRKMREEGRIGRVPYEPSKPVYTFWDLGFGDNTAIWFVQSVGMQVRVIDYYSANRQPLTHYVQMLQSRGYVYAEHGLPHDARHANLGTGKTVQEMLEELGLKIRIVPQIGIDNGIRLYAASCRMSGLMINAPTGYAVWSIITTKPTRTAAHMPNRHTTGQVMALMRSVILLSGLRKRPRPR